MDTYLVGLCYPKNQFCNQKHMLTPSELVPDRIMIPYMVWFHHIASNAELFWSLFCVSYQISLILSVN